MASIEVSFNLMQEIYNLPEVVRDQVKLFALKSPVKQDIQEHFDRREHGFHWWKVSVDWLTYVQEIEDWSTIWGHGFSIDDDGISVVYRDEQEMRDSDEETWRRPMPIREATCIAEKTVILTQREWDDYAIEVLADMDV